MRERGGREKAGGQKKEGVLGRETLSKSNGIRIPVDKSKHVQVSRYVDDCYACAWKEEGDRTWTARGGGSSAGRQGVSSMLQRGEERERKEEERKEKERRARRARREKRKRGEREEKQGRGESTHTHAEHDTHTQAPSIARRKGRRTSVREADVGPDLLGPATSPPVSGAMLVRSAVHACKLPTNRLRLTCKSKLAVRPDHSHLFRLQLRKLATVTAASVNTHSPSTRHGVVTGIAF